MRKAAGLAGNNADWADDVDIVSVTEDSRRVVPGSLFVAAPGVHADGHDYAGAAVKGGAVAILGSRPRTRSLHGVPYLYSDKPREALGVIAQALHGNPSESMTVLGVTGTNGKSSTVSIIGRILELAGHSPAEFGTLGYTIGGHRETAPHTTPFGEDLAALFARAHDAGHTHVVMEVSSHSLEQERVAGIDYDVAAFTNLTQDHLDYHGTMDEYRRAKLMLFERITGPKKFTVVNSDDPSAAHFAGASSVQCYTYGRDGQCRAENVRHEIEGTRFKVRTPWGACDIEMALLGNHNVSNALCAISVCAGLGISLPGIAAGIGQVQRVPGRFDRVLAGQPFHVVVDYAHTDDGLKNVLSAAREVCSKRVICVFGCGGDRDRTKRPKMGRVAGLMSDFAIITSDNPRTEDPDKIIEEIEPGIIDAGRKRDRDYLVMADRAAAINAAISMADPGDLVMIAGKGHEDYQILGTRKIHFDDREVATEAIQKCWK